MAAAFFFDSLAFLIPNSSFNHFCPSLACTRLSAAFFSFGVGGFLLLAVVFLGLISAFGTGLLAMDLAVFVFLLAIVFWAGVLLAAGVLVTGALATGTLATRVLATGISSVVRSMMGIGTLAMGVKARGVSSMVRSIMAVLFGAVIVLAVVFLVLVDAIGMVLRKKRREEIRGKKA